MADEKNTAPAVTQPVHVRVNADQELTEYLEKPTTALDWVGITALMLSTYMLCALLLYIFISWGANNGPNQESRYHACMIFNVSIFGVYILTCAILWKIFIGKREQMKEDLIQKKLKIQEEL